MHKKPGTALFLLCLCGALLLTACRGDSSDSPPPAGAQETQESSWVGAWGTSPYGPFPLGPLSQFPLDPLSVTALSLFADEQAVDQSFRMIVHPTMGGEVVRLRLSNLMGDRPVTFTSVQIAQRAAGSSVVPGTETPLLFDGGTDITIPPGQHRFSDPAEFAFAFGDDLAVSFHVVGESGPMTWHAVSFGFNYVGAPQAGDVTGDPTGLSFAPQPTIGWFFITGLDVLKPQSPGSIVALGDSITDGAFEVPESNTRWTDLFAQRLAASGIEMGVLNKGINSNTVTEAGTEPYRGPPAVWRFDRDVLQQAGVRSVIIFEGTNDLTAGADADRIYAGLESLIERAHAQGLCVVLGTIPPRDDVLFGWDRETMEAQRQALNAMIRANTDIAGIADFDAALGNPLDPSRPNPAYYSPDLLHPTTAGFQVMAEAVPVEALMPPPYGSCDRSG